LLLATRAVVVGVAAPALVRLDLARLQRLLEPRRKTSLEPDPRRAAVRAEEVVDGALRRCGPFVRPGCLARGLARYSAMRRAGIDVALCFGVGRPAENVEGHCWLVLDEEVLFEPPDSEAVFTPVVTVSGRGVR
jgi:hypothetical protein